MYCLQIGHRGEVRATTISPPASPVPQPCLSMTATHRDFAVLSPLKLLNRHPMSAKFLKIALCRHPAFRSISRAIPMDCWVDHLPVNDATPALIAVHSLPSAHGRRVSNR